MKKTAYAIFLSVILFAVVQFSPQKKYSETVAINFKWYKSYPTESWDMVKKGMLWSFSYLGAALPKNCLDNALVFSDSSAFSINLNLLGFSRKSLDVLNMLCDSIKNTEDYRANNAIDLSRFFMLTLYSSYHYYKITGVEPKLDDFIKKYRLQQPHFFGVTKSSVSKSHRLIKFTTDTILFSFGFLAEEGHGSLHENTFKTEVFEAFDIMPNGQFRYAVYDKQGRLTDASSDIFSTAGKTGKCMWCHETYMQPLYTTNIAIANMLPNNVFEEKIIRFQQIIDNYRKTLSSEINFTNKQDHTASELLYIGFMEPSLYRLSNELKKDSSELKKIIKEPTHMYEEFPFLGNLYNRIYTDCYFSYMKIRVPEYVREKSSYEPNYFK